MEKMVKVLSVIITLFLVGSTLVTTAFVTNTSDTDIVLVKVDGVQDVSRIESFGMDIIDRYGHYALVQGTGPRIKDIQNSGLEVNLLKDRTVLSVKGHKFEMNKGPSDIPAKLMAGNYDPEVRGRYIVHMLGPVNPEWRDTLDSKDVEIVNYIPNFAYHVRMKPEMKNEIMDLEFVDWIGLYHPGYKLKPDVQPGEIEAFVSKSSTTKSSLQEVSEYYAETPTLTKTSTGDYKLKGQVSSMENIENIAKNLDVYWVNNYNPPVLHDEIGIQIVGGYFNPDDTGSSPYRGPGDHGSHANQLGYDGSGITIQVADTGLGDGTTPNAGHNDFTSRVVGGTDMGSTVDGWNDGHGHGTHCAGLATGDTYSGNGITYAGWTNFYTGQGSAPGAGLWATQIFEDDGSGDMPGTDYEIPEDGKQNGAYVSSNSWGESRGDSAYAASDSDYDRAVRDADSSTGGDQPMSIVVAAGNSGSGASTIGSPGSGKNVITVGASRNYMPDSTSYGNSGSDTTDVDYVADFSSRGPESDGRIKPDVTAPGETTLSTSTPANVDNLYGLYSEDGRYEWCSGTSQACPTVSGAAAVVADYYQSTYGSLPSPEMIKALIINAAQDMDDASGTDPIPNYDEGWGRTFLPPIVDQNKYPDWMLYDRPSQMTTGDIDSYSIEVQDTSVPMNISMVYTDNEAASGDNPTLKNDLQLRVTDPGGTVWYGNAFNGGMSVSGSGQINGDWDTNGDDNDDRNNLENVFIPTSNLQTGTYTVEVEAFNVPEDGIPETTATDQDYALAMYNAQAPTSGDNTAPTVDLTRPDGGETFTIGDTETIWWNMSDGEDANTDLTVDLYYSNDGGGSWNAIQTGIAGTADPNSYDWTVPNDPTTDALVRADVTDTNGATSSDQSAGTFTIQNTAPTVDLTQPDGGEVWTSGEVQTIWWNMSDQQDANTDLTVDLYYSNDNGGSWNAIQTGIAGTANPNSYDWTVPNDPTTDALVRVDVTDTNSATSSDTSASTFTIEGITGPSITINDPNGGEVWDAGTNHDILWDSTAGDGTITGVTLEYTSDGGGTWNEIVANTTDDGAYTWTVPDDDSTNCLVRGTVYDDNSLSDSDTSDNTFEIVGIPPAAPSGLSVEHYGITSTESNDTASSDTVNTGTVSSGDYTSTQTQDDVYHQIQEEQTGGGGPQVRYGLEVVYSVDIAADSNGPYTLNLDAYRDDTEDYPIEYQVDGGGYNAFDTITSGTDTDTYLSGELNGVGAGSVVDIRITDNAGTGGENQGTLYVDHLYINSTGESSSGTEDNAVNWTASGDDGAGDGDVTTYNIYRADTEAGLDGAAVYDTMTADGSAEYSYIDAGAGDADSTLWWYRISAVDVDSLESGNTSNVQEPGGDTYDLFDISLTAGGDASGWNFVSFNLDANGDNYAQANDLVEILEDTEYGVSGNYDKVMYYDAANDQWRSYVPGRAEHYNDIYTWDNTMGIWIQMNTGDTLTVEGTAPTSTDISLSAGWNMVSYPSSTVGDGTELPAEVTRVGYFDATAEYNVAYATTEAEVDGVALNPGEAYWLYCSAATTWTVTY